MTILVHHLEYSRSLRVLWLLEELGLDYSVQQWKRDRNFRAPDDARKVHPLGRFPMVEVDGHLLAESGAILEYFAEREQKLVPGSDEDRRRFHFFMHYAEGSAMPPLLVQLIVDKARTAKVPFFVKPIVNGVVSKIEQGYSGPAIELHFGFLDNELASRPYFAGNDFSLADIQMYYAVEAGLSRGRGKRPNLVAWRNRVTQRDAFKRAEAKGGTAIPKQA